MKIAYAGSFDPFTNGHLHIIEKTIGMMPGVQLVILIAKNAEKNPRWPANIRANMIQEVVKKYPNVSVEILPTNMYAVEQAKNLGCNTMIRGIRTEKDFQDESGVYNANKLICKTMETLYIMPDINLSAVSSSLVMGLVGPVGWLDTVKQLVPYSVFLKICEKYSLKKANADKEFIGDLSIYDKMPYHNWEHIAYCITELCRLGYGDTYLIQGLLLHDAVNPNCKKELLQFAFYGMSAFSMDVIWHAIKATDHEHIGEEDLQEDDQKIIHDIDMSILASEPNKYQSYVRVVRDEYVSVKGIDLNVFKEGRKKFIQSLLNKDRIFFTLAYNEDIARRNLKQELIQL